VLTCQVAAFILGRLQYRFVVCVMGCCEGVRTSACKEWKGRGVLKQRVGLALNVVRLRIASCREALNNVMAHLQRGFLHAPRSSRCVPNKLALPHSLVAPYGMAYETLDLGVKVWWWRWWRRFFVFNDTIEGPRAPAVKPGRVAQI
jgi:hypothetical protein